MKWIEDRLENLQAAGQAREERFDVEAAYDADGTVRAVRVAMVFDQGAYQLTTLPPTIFPTIVRVLFPGAYRLRDLEFDVKVVATNKATYVAYRGPWEAETFVRERMLDEIAADIGLPPEVVRRRNLLAPDEFPTRLATDVSFAHVTAARRSRPPWPAPIPTGSGATRSRRGRRAATGVSGSPRSWSPLPGPPDYTRALGAGAAPRSAQRATARLEPDGSLTVFTSQSPHGQGHHTTLAQLAADELGVPLEGVRIVAGDTQVTPFNLVGTGGSRAATLASGAVIGAVADIREQVTGLAAHLLEADPADVEARRRHRRRARRARLAPAPR